MGSARRRWQRAGDTVVVALFAAGELEIWLSHESGSKPAAALFAVAWTSPLLLRRRFPLAAPLAAVAGSAGASFLVANLLQTTGAPIFSGVVAGWALGRRNKRARALIGLVTGLALAQIAILHFSKVGVGDVVYASMTSPTNAASSNREGRTRPSAPPENIDGE